MAAVVRPVGINDANLGDGRIALLIGKVLLAEGEVSQVHSKAVRSNELLEAVLVKGVKALKNLYVCRLRDGNLESLGQLKGSLASFNGVDQVVFDGGNVCLSEVSGQHIEASGAHQWTLSLADELHTFSCRVCALVKLTRQKLNSKRTNSRTFRRKLWHGTAGKIGLWLGENGGDAGLKEFL